MLLDISCLDLFVFIEVGGQEHFYLETQGVLCVPKSEHGEMEVFSSTQAPRDTQTIIASVLGVERNKITVRTKRVGGFEIVQSHY